MKVIFGKGFLMGFAAPESKPYLCVIETDSEEDGIKLVRM